ncbi:MAG TPA: extracellular solute-binding protein [Anaerolineae bacterium]|nr:extracellular solute-binding protein [Anaerolineae bacterium]
MNASKSADNCHVSALLIVALVLALLMSACAPAATPTSAPAQLTAQPNAMPATAAVQPAKPTESAVQATPAAAVPTVSPTAAPAAPAFVSQPSGKKTSSGFDCPEPQPKVPVTSKTLNLFVWTEYVPQDMLDCFEQVYGIKINKGEYSSNEEMYAKLAQGSSQFDLAQPSDYIISVMIRTGILDKFDKSKLPNLKNITPQLAHVPGDPNGDYIVPYEAGTESIVYNADTVSDPPQSWNDLWKPEFAGRMVFADDPRYVIGAVLLAAGKDPNTTNPDDLKAIKPQLAELLRGVKLFDSDSPKTALIAGDVDLGYVFNGEAFLAAKENPAFKYVYPKEGTFLWQDGFGLVKDAPHPDAAYAWLNYMLQPDVFWLMLRDFPYTNPNQAALEYARNATFKVKDADGNEVSPAELYDAYMKSNITNPPAEVWQNGINIKDVGNVLPQYDKLWTEVKSGH